VGPILLTLLILAAFIPMAEAQVIPGPPKVIVMSPNGGEVWKVGSVQKIKFSWVRAFPPMIVKRIDIYYSTGPVNGVWKWTIIATLSGYRLQVGYAEYSWTIPNTPSTSCKVRVDVIEALGMRGSDISDRPFTIKSR